MICMYYLWNPEGTALNGAYESLYDLYADLPFWYSMHNRRHQKIERVQVSLEYAFLKNKA